MPIDPNLLRIIIIIVVGGLLFLAFTYLVEFFLPLITAIALIIIAYIIYRFSITGSLGI